MSKVLLGVVLCMTTIHASCQSSSIKDYLQKQYADNVLNGNVLVVKGKEVLYEQSFGYAHPTTKEKLTSAHRFQVGSIYKEFPGVAIMQLKEQGKLKLSDPIKGYLPEMPEWAARITIQHLLQYTSGLPRVPWGDFFKNNTPVTEQSILALLKKTEALAFAPGSDYLYSNYNPWLLTQIVEKITKQSFEMYVQENLFLPAQMDKAFFASQFPYKDEQLVAFSFNEDKQLDRYIIQVPLFLMNLTAKDLYQWLFHLHHQKLISKAAVQQLSERVGAQSPLGVLEWKDAALEVHHHHGSSGNYEAVIRYYPEDDLYIVILTNRKNGNVTELATEIHALVQAGKGN